MLTLPALLAAFSFGFIDKAALIVGAVIVLRRLRRSYE